MTHDAFVSNNIKIPLVEEQEALYQIVRKAMWKLKSFLFIPFSSLFFNAALPTGTYRHSTDYINTVEPRYFDVPREMEKSSK